MALKIKSDHFAARRCCCQSQSCRIRPNTSYVVLDAQLLDAPEVDRAGVVVGTVRGVSLVKLELRQISAFLASDTGNNSDHR